MKKEWIQVFTMLQLGEKMRSFSSSPQQVCVLFFNVAAGCWCFTIFFFLSPYKKCAFIHVPSIGGTHVCLYDRLAIIVCIYRKYQWILFDSPSFCFLLGQTSVICVQWNWRIFLDAHDNATAQTVTHSKTWPMFINMITKIMCALNCNTLTRCAYVFRTKSQPTQCKRHLDTFHMYTR